MPIGPPVTATQFSKIRERISPNASVVSAKYTPRNRRDGYPIRKPNPAVTRTASGSAAQNERGSAVVAKAEAYAPMPMKPAWAILNWPAIPVIILKPYTPIAKRQITFRMC